MRRVAFKKRDSPEYVRNMNIFHRNKNLFGGNREAVIIRDGEKCVACGMTRAEHYERFGKDITVDHIDKQGSSVPIEQKNNSMDNLQTLCMPCHGLKDNYAKRLTDIQVINIRHIGNELTAKEISIAYDITTQYVGQLLTYKRRVKYNELEIL